MVCLLNVRIRPFFRNSSCFFPKLLLFTRFTYIPGFRALSTRRRRSEGGPPVWCLGPLLHHLFLSLADGFQSSIVIFKVQWPISLKETTKRESKFSSRDVCSAMLLIQKQPRPDPRSMESLEESLEPSMVLTIRQPTNQRYYFFKLLRSIALIPTFTFRHYLKVIP